MSRIARDLSKGNVGFRGIKAAVKSYAKGDYIILKGYQKMRPILQLKPTWLKTDPKIVQLGLGEVGAKASIKAGGILTVVLLCSFHVMDYFVRDTATLSELFGHLGVDLAKAAVATGLAFGAVNLSAALGMSLAMGPLFVGIVAGFAMARLLDNLDEQLGASDLVVSAIETAFSGVSEKLASIERKWSDEPVIISNVIAPSLQVLKARSRAAWPSHF